MTPEQGVRIRAHYRQRMRRRQEWLASLPAWLTGGVPDFGVAVLTWRPAHITMKGME